MELWVCSRCGHVYRSPIPLIATWCNQLSCKDSRKGMPAMEKK